MISRSDAEVRRRLIVELGGTGMALKKAGMRVVAGSPRPGGGSRITDGAGW
jgi:hypothetical protein